MHKLKQQAMSHSINVILFLVILTFLGAGQNKDDLAQVELKWKIGNQALCYKTIMEVVDTGDIQFPNMGLFDKFIKENSDSIKKDYNEAMEFFKSFYEGADKYSTVSVLTKRKDKNIDVRMFVGDFSEKAKTEKKDSADEKSLFMSMMQGVQLRGIINENGGIESFYMKSDQKNLLAAFFQLPQKPVKKGDEWELEINWLTMDYHFICEKAEKVNKVKLLDIIERDGEQIAILKYSISEDIKGDFDSPFGKEPIPTTWNMGLEGICEFSVTKGKWKNYSAITSMTLTGYQNANYKKKFALVELDKVPEKLSEYIKD